MTCKDCIHNEVCYKKNDYDNFPDRCGDFVSERPTGEWGKWVISEIRCPNCLEYFDTEWYSAEELKKCPNCGAKMKGGAE